MIDTRVFLLIPLWLVIIITLPITIIFIAILAIYRFIVVILLRRVFNPELQPLVGLDVGFSLDNFDRPRSAIAFVHIIDGEIDVNHIRNKLRDTLLEDPINYKRLLNNYPTVWLNFPFWKEIGYFDINNHIHVQTNYCCESEMNLAIKQWLESPFKRQVPLWDVLMIPKFKDGTKSLFAFRISHSLGDGYSMLGFLEKIFDGSDRKLARNLLVVDPPMRIEKFLKNIKVLLWTPYILLQFVNDFFLHKDFLMKKKTSRNTVFATVCIKLDDIKSLRRKAGQVTMNTIILYLFSGALRSYILNDTTMELPHSVIVVCSLPVKHHPIGTFCNYWTHGTFRIPLQDPNPKERLNQLISSARSAMELKFPEVNSCFSKVIALIPVYFLRKLVNHNVSASMGMSNLPGPSNQVYIGGKRIERKLAVVGIQGEHASIMLSAFSYNGEFTLTLTANQDVIQNEEMAGKILNEYFVKELQKAINDIV